MSTFKINSINYIVGGDTEKFLNIDLSSGQIHKNITLLTDSSYTNLMYDELKNTDNTARLVIGEPTAGVMSHEKNIIYALFDFKDVAVKSDFYTKDYTAVFGPILNSNPIGFAQGTNSNVYGASSTEKINSSIIAKTNLNDTRADRLAGLSNSLFWQYKLETPGNLTYFGEYLNNYIIYSDEEKDEDGNPKPVPPGSLYRYISSFSDKETGVAAVLTPKYQDENVQKNFIYQIFASNRKSNRYKWNEFNSGNVFGNVLGAKNFYDAKYSTDVSESTSGKTTFPTREYLKIGTTGGKPFLTYNTDTPWLENGTKDGPGDLTTKTEDTSTGPSPGRKPRYDHIETIDSINRFLNRANHKSNMYSIRLNLGLKAMADENVKADSDESKRDLVAKLLNNVKLDIQNNVRKIAEELAPAHTQLFKVYIDEN